ncbi:ABC transporter ATP-binding protein [Photobacterium sp. BZF1]|uniref:ABC transporter ATP-binding protein n=1 Tax=Photobacterium sp. BZF1 TaxID=1904457 RepID=UPI00165353F4|nr:ABC transporter ATP-binding protein [Photobacterium sp. BZF1]MBC7002749.1 ABC transporter ATP-binding protein [Photobacterium sp. BZF1]
MSYLTLKALNKEFGDFQALQDIELSIERGEFIALLGPSGCGKSTLLRIIAGLESATSGKMSVEGRDVTALAPSQRGISMVFQSYALFPHLSVKENILFGLKARRVEAKERQRRLDEALELVSLQDQQDKLPSQLSGGQRQRVALARAIVSQHPICLMDEPLSNLDAKLRAEMRSELRNLQKKLGLTLIYVTHDQIEAMSMADRIVLLNQGRIQQVGTPRTLYNQPKNTFTARFIGSPAMNIFTLPEYHNLLGVRPEHIRLSDSGIRCRAVNTDYHGENTLLKVALPDEQQIVVKVDRYQQFETDQPLHVNWEQQDLHHFCSAKQQAIPTP